MEKATVHRLCMHPTDLTDFVEAKDYNSLYALWELQRAVIRELQRKQSEVNHANNQLRVDLHNAVIGRHAAYDTAARGREARESILGDKLNDIRKVLDR